MGKVVNVAPDTHEHIPRPANAWILFRRSRVTSLDGRPRQADCSKTLSNEWNAMPEDQKMPWRVLADQEKKKHKLQYPNYVYTPRPRKKKTTGKGKGKGRGSSSSTSSDRASSLSLDPEEGPVTEPSFSFPSTRVSNHYHVLESGHLRVSRCRLSFPSTAARLRALSTSGHLAL